MTSASAPTPRRARRAAIAFVALVVTAIVTACSTGSDTATTTSTTIGVPRPSQSVDELVPIGAGRLHIRCRGRGRQTLLLMAGWDNGSDTWRAVEPSLAEHTRVCSYDRFGTGTSDPPATAQTFETQVADLHELLSKVHEPGPYVVVGHSFGGAEAVTFTATFPDEVIGLMLIDASPSTWPETVCSVPEYAPACNLMHNPTQGERLDVFPAFGAVHSISTLGDLPMTVMTATHRSSNGITADELQRLDGLWWQGTQRWAELSSASKVVTVDHTGHEIQIDQPTVVIAEVTKLLR